MPKHFPKSRSEGLGNGSKFYYTGKSCKHSHYSLRYSSSTACLSCCKLQGERWYSENRDWVLGKRRENKKEIAEYMRDWRERRKEHRKKYTKIYRIENKEKINFLNRKRYSEKRNAVPRWADPEEIQYIYSLATEKGLVVDHIVPLNSPYVCGLHTGDNLRCISNKLNVHKGNRYWPDMPEEFVEVNGGQPTIESNA